MVLLTARVTWACRLLVIGALECCTQGCTLSTSGTRLKVENPGTDPPRNCLDWRAHQFWWITSVRKCSGSLFEGCVFFCYFFTYCWLLSWRTKLKLTPCTKLADTRWKTLKTALKTSLQSWTNFQWAFLQLMSRGALTAMNTSRNCLLKEHPIAKSDGLKLLWYGRYSWKQAQGRALGFAWSVKKLQSSFFFTNWQFVSSPTIFVWGQL